MCIMEFVFSILMAAMGVSMLIYAGFAYLEGDPIIMFQGVYSFPKDKEARKEYVRKKFVKSIALIAVSFLASALVGLSQIYWLAVAVFVLGIVFTIKQGKKIMGEGTSVNSVKMPSVQVPTNYYAYYDGVPLIKKLDDTIAQRFSQYSVRHNVSPIEIGGAGKFMNYSVGVYLNGAPKLFIMIVGKNTCKLRLYRWSKEQADKVGIPMINFVEHFPNRLEYVAERIGRYL